MELFSWRKFTRNHCRAGLRA